MSGISLGVDVDSTEVGKLDQKLEGVADALKDLGAEAQRTNTRLDATEGSLRDTTRATDALEDAVKRASDETRRMGGSLGGLSGGFGRLTAMFGGLSGVFGGLVGGLVGGLGRLGGAADGARDALGDLGGGLSNLRTNMTAVITPARLAVAAIMGFIGGQMIGQMTQFSISLQKIRTTLLAVTGSASLAAAEFDYVREAADRFGQDYLQIGNAYAKLLASAKPANLALSDTRTLFEGITAAGTAMSLSSYEVEGALNAVQQMISKGSVQAEELRGQLGERIPGAYQIAADAMGMTTAELSKALEQGAVDANDFVRKFGAKLNEMYGGIAENTDNATRSMNECDNVMNEFRRIISDSGFTSALGAFYEFLSTVMGSQAAIDIARGLGRAFSEIADNLTRWNSQFAQFDANLTKLQDTTVTYAGTTSDRLTMLTSSWMALRQRTSEFGVKLNEMLAVADAHLIAFLKSAVEMTKWMANTTIGIFVGLMRSIGSILAHLPGIFAAAWDKTVDVTLKAGKAVWEALKAGLTGGDPGNVLKDFMADALDVSGVMNDVAAAANAAGTSFSTSMRDYVGETGVAIEKIVEGTDYWADATRRVAEQHQGVLEAEKLARLETIKTGKATEAMAAAARDAADATKPLGEGMDNAGKGAKGAADGAKAINDRLKEARDLLREQLDHYREIEERLRGGTGEAGYAAEQMKKMARALEDAGISMDDFLNSVGLTRDAYQEMLDNTEKMTDALKSQEKIAGDISDLFGGLMTPGEGGIKDQLQSTIGSIQDTLSEPLRESVEKGVTSGMAKLGQLANKSGLLKSIGPELGSALGTGLMSAVGGALSGNSMAIGGGVGMALGAAIGSVVPVIGTTLGAMLGSALGSWAGSALGGDDKWKGISGTAFDKTSFAQNVTTASVNTETTMGLNPEGRIAWEGTKALLADFDAELKEYVVSLGGTVKQGTRLVIDEQDALLAITGTLDERGITYRGSAGKEAAEQINARVSAIMGIASQIITAAGPPLTEAQKLWRETQKKFNAENVAILKELGFAGKQIRAVQHKVRDDLVQTFELDLVRELAASGQASAEDLKAWRAAERAMIDAERAQALATAREIGGDTSLVKAAFASRYASLGEQYRDYLEELSETTGEVIARYSDADRDTFRQGPLANLARSGNADRETLLRWRALEERQIRRSWVETRRQAEAMGFGARAMAELRAAMLGLPLKDLAREFRELTTVTVESVAKVTRAEQDALLRPALSTLVEAGAGLETLTAWRKLEAREIERSWAETRRQAEASKMSRMEIVLLKKATLDLPLKQLRDRFRELKAALDDAGDSVATATRADRDALLGPALSTLVEAGAGMKTLLAWRKLETREIERAWRELRAQAIASKLSRDEMRLLRRASLDLPLKQLREQFRELTTATRDYSEAIAKAEDRRSRIETELVERVNQMTQAERALKDARKALAISDLAPGTEMDQLSAMMGQFRDLAAAARGGDAEAGTRLAQMAQDVLGQAGLVYGASEKYGAIFESVNRALVQSQKGIGAERKEIRAELDGDLFRTVTNQSTAKLLKGLARIEDRLAALEAAQDKANRRAEKRAGRTATGA